MSLRWIYENLEPPNVDEECSDIDDSCSSDDSYDSDVMPVNTDVDKINGNNNYKNSSTRTKRETVMHPTTIVTIDKHENQQIETDNADQTQTPSVPWNATKVTNDSSNQPLKLKLYCRTGYYIGITGSGRVKGFTADHFSEQQVRFVACPVSDGIVRLQNAHTGYYLAFNATGHLYGERKMKKDNTEWEHWHIGNYEAYLSHKYAEAGWWLGIKRNGRQKPGPKTAWGQKSIQILPIRLT